MTMIHILKKMKSIHLIKLNIYLQNMKMEKSAGI